MYDYRKEFYFKRKKEIKLKKKRELQKITLESKRLEDWKKFRKMYNDPAWDMEKY